MSDLENKQDRSSAVRDSGAKASPGRSVLGRGLGSLIPIGLDPGMAGPESFLCPIDKIKICEIQPRVEFNNKKLADLATSISHSGILQPVVVRREGDEYVIVAGERRTRAAKMAGLTKVPVVVKDVSPEDAYELALVENVQREDLGPLEEAEAYKRLLEERGYTQEQLASRLGKDRTTIANSLRLLKLHVALKEMVQSGELTAGHARALLGLTDEGEQLRLATLAVERGYSVRAVEEAVRQKKARAAGGDKAGAGEAGKSRARKAGSLVGESGDMGALVPELPSLPDLPPLPDFSNLSGRGEVAGRTNITEASGGNGMVTGVDGEGFPLDSYSSEQLAAVLEERLGLGVKLRSAADATTGETGDASGEGVLEITFTSRTDLTRLLRLLFS